MKIRFGYITLVSMLVMLMHSCIEYDMSYPRQLAEFSVFEVEDAENVSIDPSTMTVTITLDEAADLADVHRVLLELGEEIGHPRQVVLQVADRAVQRKEFTVRKVVRHERLVQQIGHVRAVERNDVPKDIA